MGVKGLTAFLRSRVLLRKEELRTDQTLIIDVSGFLFHVLKKYDNCMIRMGDYKQLHEIVVEEIKSIQSCKIEVICVFDGMVACQ